MDVTTIGLDIAKSVFQVRRIDASGRNWSAGNRYPRMLLEVAALSVIRRAKQSGYRRGTRLAERMARRSTKVAAVGLANKIARTAWAMMAHGTRYRGPRRGRFDIRAGTTRAHQVGKGNRRIMHPAGRSGDQDAPRQPGGLHTGWERNRRQPTSVRRAMI